MNKRTINKEVYENYVDATVALLMECYAVDTLEENIQAELSAEKCEQVEFPAQLDDRCRRLLKKKMTRSNAKKCLKRCLKGLRYAAASLVVMLALSSVLFMTVEAVRVPVMNYFITEQDGHWEISGETDKQYSKPKTKVNIREVLDNVMPEGYQCDFFEERASNNIAAIYKNADGKRIFFDVIPDTSWMSVDSENAQVSKKHNFFGYDAVTVVKNGNASLNWINPDAHGIFLILAEDMSEDEILTLGEQLISSLD